MKPVSSIRYSLVSLCLKLSCFVWAAAFSANLCYAQNAAPVVPDERDRQVLECLMLHLLADQDFDLVRVTTREPSIVLHASIPEKTGFLGAGQIRSDRGAGPWREDAESDLRRRNTPAGASPDAYEAVKASYTNLKFSSGIEVDDLTGIWKQSRSFRAFTDAHPSARGWMQAYLPGYAKDGTHAAVRASVGPTMHGAMLTAVLEKADGKWVVKWCHIAYFA